ncbi:MAG: cytochrome c [Rhizobiales bacterium]|nr:cytochrome c [Hyphomicrobiales bacterium]
MPPLALSQATFIGSLILAMTVNLSTAAMAEATRDADRIEPRTLILPMVDAERGRLLFVTKGCVLCHAVNGAGGVAAPALDAAGGSAQLDLMGFVVRMWNGAQAMIELQAFELGYQIELTGEEIGDLAAFAASPEAQRRFTMQAIPDAMQSWIIDKPYWMGDGWPESFEQEYHEDGLPLDYR